MLRRLFTLASAVSLVLCAATCALWVRSYSTADSYAWPRATGVSGWVSSAGLFAHFTLDADPPTRLVGPFGYHAQPAFDPSRWVHLSYAVGIGDAAMPVGDRTLSLDEARVPYWVVAAASASLPGIHLVRALGRLARSRRFAVGRCPRCGYDLRATPGRCPECGAGPGAGRTPGRV